GLTGGMTARAPIRLQPPPQAHVQSSTDELDRFHLGADGLGRPDRPAWVRPARATEDLEAIVIAGRGWGRRHGEALADVEVLFVNGDAGELVGDVGRPGRGAG